MIKKILLGNEAIVQGAREAGVQFVSTFPGTPASEIGNTFFKLHQEKKFKGHFEFSVNEKVAMEAGIGSSFSGLKTLVAMKHFGLNVCSEALIPFLYTGTKGPTVIAVADDPSCWSSAQSEQNSRGYSYLAHIPTLEPSDPQECKDFTKLAFSLSEKFKIPIMVRTTTRVSHQKMPVEIQAIPKIKATGTFVRDIKRFVTMPPRVLEMKKELLEKIEKISKIVDKSKINYISGSKNKTVIISSGISHLYVMEAMKELKVSLPVLKIGSFYPLPKEKLKRFIKGAKKILIVEELEPYIEKEVREINSKVQIFGKNLLPETGEFSPEIVTSAIAKVTNKKFKLKEIKLDIPKRFPQLCPGCPYWLVFGAVKKALPIKTTIFGGDIGCYMLADFPPHSIQDYLFCMGSSIGIAHGIKKVSKQKLVTFIGDGTFFHAGIPALINTVFNKSNPLIIIVDNRITAMTGHQPNPGAPLTPNGIKIENIVKACGVKNLKIIDPINQKELIGTIKDFSNKKDVSVIIARRPCVFVVKK